MPERQFSVRDDLGDDLLVRDPVIGPLGPVGRVRPNLDGASRGPHHVYLPPSRVGRSSGRQSARTAAASAGDSFRRWAGRTRAIALATKGRQERAVPAGLPSWRAWQASRVAFSMCRRCVSRRSFGRARGRGCGPGDQRRTLAKGSCPSATKPQKRRRRKDRSNRASHRISGCLAEAGVVLTRSLLVVGEVWRSRPARQARAAATCSGARFQLECFWAAGLGKFRRSQAPSVLAETPSSRANS
jgi:hypothetical protein